MQIEYVRFIQLNWIEMFLKFDKQNELSFLVSG